MQIKIAEFSKNLMNEPAVPLPAVVNGLLHKKVVAKGKHQLELEGVTQTIELDETLIKTGANQWHVLGKVIGKGGFGTVYNSNLKITLREGQAFLEHAGEVIKCISLGVEAEETFQEILAEANFQKRHRIATQAIVRQGNQAYIVSENCGVTLSEILARPGLDFDFRIQLLLAVANELLLLEQTGVVHRDLKPSNICIQMTSKGLRATVIDFGLAQPIERPDYQNWGTLGYVSPETFAGKASTHASDRWAFAGIAGEILGCDRGKLFKDAFFVNGPYKYDTLLKKVKIPADVDPVLIKDLKILLSNQSSINPDNREPLDLIIKFLLLIPTRRAIYREFNQQWQKLEKELQELQQECRLLNIDSQIWNGKSILKGSVKFDHSKPFIKHQLDKLNNDVIKAIRELKPLGRHLLETVRLLTEQCSAQEYKVQTPDLSLVTQNVAALTAYLKSFHKYTPKLAESLNTQHFAGSNSSGIHRIQAIIESNKSAFEKLMLLKDLGESKTKSSLFNWYSRSNFFGNGRHANMETLYTKLAQLSPESNEVEAQLNELSDYTKQHSFSV